MLLVKKAQYLRKLDSIPYRNGIIQNIDMVHFYVAKVLVKPNIKHELLDLYQTTFTFTDFHS